jgi:hypothetical protein
MLTSWLVLTLVLIGICVINADTNWIISAYGVRTYVLHVPFVFLIGRHLPLRDLRRIGQVLIALTLPMAILVAIQFLSSPSAWVNVAAGGDLASQQGGVEDRIRPPGTFTYGAGLGSYLTLVLCFLALEVRISRGANCFFAPRQRRWWQRCTRSPSAVARCWARRSRWSRSSVLASPAATRWPCVWQASAFW